MTVRRRLGMIVYAPALVENDGRTLSIVQGMEQALPGLRLAWKVSKEGQPIALPQRDAWLLEGTRDGGFPLLCNGDERSAVTVTGWERRARLSPGGQALLEVHAKMPLDEPVVVAVANVLECVAEGARALWGHATPDGAALDIAYQTAPTRAGSPAPPRGLPALGLFEQIRAPEIPYYLGWVNYWSAAAAHAIGFPDPARDADLLSRSRRTAKGGWVVQLTREPLDLDAPDQLNTLLRTYERFPEIGGRLAR